MDKRDLNCPENIALLHVVSSCQIFGELFSEEQFIVSPDFCYKKLNKYVCVLGIAEGAYDASFVRDPVASSSFFFISAFSCTLRSC